MADARELLQVGASLKLDAVAAELVALLEQRGGRAILLKGSAIADRLYAGESRSHSDADLLVRDRAAAADALTSLGFERALSGDYAEPWIRAADGVTIDVHTTLPGIGASAEDTWEVLAAETEALRVGGRDVQVFGDAALALHVALHATQHGERAGKSIDDLERAVEQLPAETWERAAALAARLDATPAFAAGLRLLPRGAEVAEQLGLSYRTTPEVALLARSAPPTAIGIQKFASTRGVRSRAALVARELAPPPPFMRAMYPFARYGRAGLAASYVWRPLWLVRHAPAAIAAVRRARREAAS
jgi:hypothetical protein